MFNKTIIYLVEKAKDRDSFSQLEVSEIISAIDNHARGGRFDWKRFWTSDKIQMSRDIMHTSDRSTKTNLQSNPKSTNVKTSIDNLAKD